MDVTPDCIAGTYAPVVVAGHPYLTSGRGEETRAWIQAFKHAGLDVKAFDIYGLQRPTSDFAALLDPYLSRELSNVTNLFVLNGDEIEQALNHLAGLLPHSAHNIVYPQWELARYPASWAAQLERFDEIWVSSAFVHQAISSAVAKPCFVLPAPIGASFSGFLMRRHFHIEPSAFVFLFLFDFSSFIERKNPLAVLRAFRRYCERHPYANVRLALKVFDSHRPLGENGSVQDLLRHELDRKCLDRLILIDRRLSANEMSNLIRCCDSFLSLHRAEGFGRGLAEAMLLGKPVIGTAYSGNMQFMTQDNSCRVNYNLIPVPEGAYPAWEDQVWADPDVDEALWYMEKLVDDPGWGHTIGARAARDIHRTLSYQTIGLAARDRLAEIQAIQTHRASG